MLEAFALERYKYILQQIHALNENVYKFLAIYQTLATAIVSSGLVLFVSYKKLELAPETARAAITGLMWLETVVAAFTIVLIVIGVVSWIDYRNEECELTNEVVHEGFRKPPKFGNMIRWYETYIILFIAASTAFMWIYAHILILPKMK
ncbi:hypothetical protein GCM10027088_38980 [Nocardia goodfellowii]